MEGCKRLILSFENNGPPKKIITFYLDENASIQTKNCIVALSTIASIIFGSLVQQVWVPLAYDVTRRNDFLNKINFDNTFVSQRENFQCF